MKFTGYCVFVIILFLINGCYINPKNAENKVELNGNETEIASKQDQFSTTEFLKIPEFTVDWSQYPVIDVDKLTKKPFPTYQRIPNCLSIPEPKMSSNYVGKYYVWGIFGERSIQCIDMEKHHFLWKKRGYAYNEVIKKTNSLLCIKEPVYQGDPIRGVVSINLATGQENWRYTRPEWNKGEEILPYILDNDDETILLESKYPDFGIGVAIDARTGKQLWEEKDAKTYKWRNLLYTKGKILNVTPEKTLICINRVTGKIEWQNNQIGWPVGLGIKYESPLIENYFSLSEPKILLNISDYSKGLLSVVDLNLLNGEATQSSIDFNNSSLNHWVIQDIRWKEIKPGKQAGYLILSQDDHYYLSQVDITTMKEEWRNPIGKWNLNEKFSYFDVLTDNTLPGRIFLNWNGNMEENSYETNQEPTRLLDGFYEIDVSNGKFLWWSRFGYYIDNGILSFSEPSSIPDRHKIQFGYLDMKSKKILSVVNLTSKMDIEREGYIDPNNRIYSIRGDRQEKGIISYLEIDSLTSSVVAFYPNLFDENMEYFVISQNTRFFKIRNQDEMLIMNANS